MPYGFLKKYGSMLHFLRRMEQEAHVTENKEYRDYYTQVKRLNKLLVDEEKLQLVLKKERDLQPDIVTQASLQREEGDYFKRQPRVNIDQLSYNREQFKRYTKIFNEAKSKDDAKSERFFKVL